MVDLERFFVYPDQSIRETIGCLDRAGAGILLVVDHERILLGIVTDGDIRRAILHEKGLDNAIEMAMSRQPLVAPPGLLNRELLRLMDEGKRSFTVHHLPIVDERGRVIDLVSRSTLVTSRRLDIPAVVMAGGYGTRLRPLTDEIPKPMLSVGGRPVLELVVESLQQAGVHHITVTTHYKAEAITQHFRDGRDFGVEIEYVHEEQPTGTAGSLALVTTWDQPLLVVNGDVLTSVDYPAMLRYHRKHEAAMTVAVREYHLEVPYGIVEVDDARILGITEKPTVRFLVNAGIYVLEPSVRGYTTPGEFMDMTDVVGRLLEDDCCVVAFPVRESWIDIGDHPDYQRARESARTKEV